MAYVYENPATTGTLDQFGPRTQRVSRFRMDPANPDVALKSSETVILGKISTPGCSGVNQDCMPNDGHEHTIDHLAFGPDGKLYVSAGDGSSSTGTAANAFRAQNLDHLNGKILRINIDGTGPSDNPFYNGNPNANRSKVYAYGLRNPYRFTVNSSSIVYIGDVGWYSWEEINTGRGKNFGWPCYEGAVDSSGKPYSATMSRYQTDFASQCSSLTASIVTAPTWAYSHVDGSSVVMGPQYSGTAYPSTYRNNLFFADYGADRIQRIVLDSTGKVSQVVTFATGIDAPVYLTQGPDGRLYVVSFATGIIWKINHTGGNQAPIAKASASPNNGYSPLSVNFSSAGSSDPDGDAISYRWDFGDGQTSTLANPTHIYSATGVRTFTATLTVTDSSGLTGVATVKVTVGSAAPTATIYTPANGTVVHDGDVVSFSGAGSDPDDGTLSGASLRWLVLLKHNQHFHTVLETTGSGGSFTATDHDPVGTFSYQIQLTAADSSGLTNTRTILLPFQHTGSVTCSPASPGAAVCTPAAGATVPAPVHFTGAATPNPGYRISAIYALVDNVLIQKFLNVASFSLDLNLAPGPHSLRVQAWDTSGALFKPSAINITTVTTPCTLSAPGAIICTPANGQAVSSPVHLSAKAQPNSGYIIDAIRVYLDNILVSQSSRMSSIDTNVTVPSGAHNLRIQAWDTSGALFMSGVNITVP